MIDSPPRKIMDVFRTLPEGTLAELIDSVLYMSPSPSFDHQNISKSILRHLLKFEDSGRGIVFHAPFDVYLDEKGNAVQPDLFVVLAENTGIIDRKGHVHGVPDFIIEILSPGNREHDTTRKKQLYQRFGVKEYWIIDPENKLATGFELKDKTYHLIAEDIGIVKSKFLSFSFTF